MAAQKILMSNLGYARGLNGGLAQHVLLAHRHFLPSRRVQEKALAQLREIIAREDPDLCCFVEIDKGSLFTPGFNQLEALLDERYTVYDIENKYGMMSPLRRLPLTRGKSNGFIARQPYPHEKLAFTHGTKRLIYKILLEPKLTLFFAHFSLKRIVRAQQLLQVQALMRETPGEVIFLGDFNVLSGLGEIAPLTEGGECLLLNCPETPTFTFHRKRLVLDLCLCSPTLTNRLKLTVIPQPFSDHAALLVELAG